MKLKPYPKYKDSGVEWLGKVPEHWDVRRVSHFFSERREKVSDKDYQPLSVTKNGVVPQLDTAAKTDDGDNRKLVLAGDFVINSRSDRKGSSGLSELNGSVSLINTVLKTYGHTDGRFAHHLFRSYPFQEEFYRYGKGIVADLWSTNYSEMRNISLAVPGHGEQSSIATFLDRQTAKLDTLIAKQEKLITLLQEKRLAIISHAVTKGLDPDVPMKDSGVEWLGMAPEHWDLPKLKYMAAFSGGGTPSRDNAAYWNGDIPWVSPKDMKTKYIIEAEESITTEGLVGSTSNMLDPGHVLMVVRSGILKHTIPVAINEVPLAINQDIKAIKLSEDRCFNQFFMYWVQGLNDLLLLAWAKQGATVESIEHAYLANSVIPLPARTEQTEIANYLDQETSKIDRLIREAKRSIDLAKEHRTALISAAVTGKIDVREAA